MTGCSHGGSQPEQSREAVPDMKQPEETAGTSYDELRNMKIEVTADTQAYQKAGDDYSSIGVFKTGALLDIDEEPAGEYLHVRGTDYYLSGADAKDSQRWFRNETNLMPYAMNLTTANHYTIETFKGQVYAEMNQAATMPVYVLPGEDDPRYGILFQNGIYYIKADAVVRTENTGESVPALCQNLPVLMYHFFYSEAAGESRKDGNYVEVEELRSHLQYMQDNGYHTLTMPEVLYYMQNRAQIPARSVAITIDDGDPTVYQYAFPVFRDYGMHATLFLITGWESPELDWSFWEMREEGLELQSHGFLTHQGGCAGMGHGGRLLCMDHAEGVEDTIRSLDYCDGGFVYCYPFGDYNDNAVSILRDAGVKLAFTTEAGRIHPGMNMLTLPRVRVHGGNSLAQFAAGIEN